MGEIKWQEQYEGKQFHDLSEKEQVQGDMRFVCEGCSVIVRSECELEYVSGGDDLVEYQYCSDCAELYETN